MCKQSSSIISSDQLQSLVETFCSQPSHTPLKKRSAYHLVTAVKSLPNLTRSYNAQQNATTQDFEEILNETLLELTQRICEDFQPDEDDYIKSLTKWINFKLRLYYKPKDQLRAARRHNTFSLDRYINEGENRKFTTFLDLLGTNQDEPTLNTIDALIEEAQQTRQKRLGREVWRYLEEDPDNRLKNCCSQKYPDCNCHLLVQKRLLCDPPIAYQAIANELGISFGTLTGHWAKKCKPLLVEIAQEIEQKLQEEI